MESFVKEAGKYVMSPKGLFYAKDTPLDVIRVIDHYLNSDVRLRFFYGDVATGRCYPEEHDIMGYIRKSYGGQTPIPILLNNKNSSGGVGILTNGIVRITGSLNDGKKVDLYRHPNFHVPIKVDVNNGKYRVLYFRNNEVDVIAVFDNEAKAKAYVRFLLGEINKY